MDICDLEKDLKELNSPDTEPEKVSIIVDRISSLVQSEVSLVEVHAFIAKIIHVKHGALGYLRRIVISKSAANDQISKIFDLLGYIASCHSLAVNREAPSILKWCQSMLLFDSSVRVKAIKWAELIVINCPSIENVIPELLESVKPLICSDAKVTPTLRQTIFSLVGALLHLHPSTTGLASEWVFQAIIKAFRDFEVSKNISLILVEGCFQALNGYLKHFYIPSEENKNIYGRLKTFCELSGQKHQLNRAALTVFVGQIHHFRDMVFRDLTFWNECLTSWIKSSSSYENQLLGLSAFSAFYRTINAIFKENVSNENKEKFDILRKPLEMLLMNNCGTKNELRRAILAVGLLSDCYCEYAMSETRQHVLNNLVSIAKISFSGPPALVSSKPTVYIDSSFRGLCLESILYLISKKNITVDLTLISRLFISLIEDYPKVPANFQNYSLNELENCFVALSLLDSFDFLHLIDLVIYQGLIRSSSHTLFVDVQLMEQEEAISYKSFLPIWMHLLTITSRGNQNSVGKNKVVAAAIYNSFVKMFLKIIAKLDLSLSVDLEDSSDPSLAFEATSPSDFHIFINLVDLFEETISLSDQSRLEKWISTISEVCIRFSRKAPLVSGFYRIITVIFQVGDKIGFWDDCPDKSLLLFLSDTIELVDKMKGELQISCLKMILSSPSSIISTQLTQVDKVVLASVRIGQGYPALLKHCISALDKWVTTLPIDDMEPILKKVLPNFDTLLQCSRDLNPVRYSQGTDKKIILKNAKGKFKKSLIGPIDSQLKSLQKQFLTFLGKLEPRICNYVLKQPECSSLLEGTNLLYTLPLPDIRAKVNLNLLIPRIIELSLSCGNRNARVAACELLHGIVLLAVERTRNPDSNPQLFGKLITTVLTLSCDPDKVINDLFNPLFLQITHYYSGRIQLKSKESAVLIDVIMEGVTHIHDASLRDFAGRCLREFLTWCLRQSTDHLNVVAVIRTICAFSTHPDASKRIGAAVAFNNIYSVIREQEYILKVYWLQLYDCFTRCLSLCTDGEDARVLTKTFEHLQRPMIERTDFFMVAMPERRIPPEMGEGLLKDVIMYTFNVCKSPQKYLRGIAQHSFLKLVKAYPSFTGVRQFLEGEHITTRDGISPLISLKYPDKCWESHLIGIMDYLTWLNEVSSLDIYPIISKWLVDSATFQYIQIFLSNSINQTDHLFSLLDFISKTLKTEAITHSATRDLAKLLFNPNLSFHDERIFSGFVSIVNKLSLSPTHSSIFTNCLPSLSQDMLIRQIMCGNSTRRLAYLLGLEVLIASSKLTFKYIGIELIKTLQSQLFLKRGQSVSCNFLDSETQKLFFRLMPFFLKCDIDFCDLFSILNDESAVEYEGNLMKKGEYTFNMFETPIVDFIISKESSLTSLLKLGAPGVKWVTTILANLYERQLTLSSIQSKEKFLSDILLQWEFIRNILDITNDNLMMLLVAISKLAPRKFGFFQSTAPGLWLLSVVKQRGPISPTDVVTFFELLPHLSTLNEEENFELNDGLTQFRRLHREYFGDLKPVEVSDYPVVMAMEKNLVSTLQLTGSLVILAFTAENTRTDDNENVKSAAGFAKPFPEEHILKGLHILLEKVHSGLLIEEAVLNTQDWITSILRESSGNVIRRYFTQILPLLVTTMQEIVPASGIDLLITKKTSAVRLLQTLYLRTSQEQRVQIENEIVLEKPDCQGIFRILTKICSRAIVVKCKETPRIKKQMRLLNCECVKLMCAVASQFTDERAYEVFVFSDFLKRNIIDESRRYNFGIDFDRLPKRKKMLTSIRLENCRKEVNPSLLYAHSQTLFDSSLNEDVRKFDLSALTVQQDTSDCITFSREIELEIDQVNDHEVMASICGVIQHMVQLRVGPCPGKLPCWLQYFLSTLSDPTYTRDSKFLILKMIHNLDSAVRVYAEDCAHIVLDCALKSSSAINYFLCDIVLMVVSWKPSLTYEGEIISNLIEFYITNATSLRRDVLKYCLTIVKGVVECWKNILNGDTLAKFVLDKIVADNEQRQYTLLTLASILLGNSICPSQPELILRMAHWVIQTIEKDAKNRDLASEVLGLILKTDSSLFGQLSSSIKKMPVNVVFGIHKFYTEITSEFVMELVREAWHGGTEVKRMALTMLLSHFSRNNQVIDEEALIRSLITDLLKLPMVQELTLQIVFQLINTLSIESINSIMPFVLRLSDHSSTKIRLLTSDILISVLQKIRVDSELTKSIRVILLKMLNDSDDTVQKKCEEFWCKYEAPRNSATKRLLWVLNNAYSAEIESDFIESACKIILEASATTVDYNLEIFEHPLEKCSFTEYQALVSHRARFSTLAPMFAPSVASELSQIDVVRPTQSSFHMRLRATAQSLLFSPTLAEVSSGTSQTTNIQPTPEYDGEFKKPTTSIRFLRSSVSISNRFAHRAVEKKVREEAQALERIKEKEGTVKLFRSYRVGDYPDIQIKHSSFLITLRELATKDAQVAKELFVALFTAIVESLSPSEYELFWNATNEIINTLLTSSYVYDSTFLSSIFRLALTNKIILDSERVCHAAKMSGLLSLGILLIEQNIASRETRDIVTKKAKRDEDDESWEWLLLAELYQASSDVDGLRGVFLDKISVEGKAAQAIEFEASLKWSDAAKAYEELFENEENSISDQRLHFYNQSYYNCLANLSNWSNMSEGIYMTVGKDLDILLNDLWSRDVLLPRYLRSNLMTSLESTKTDPFCNFVLEPKKSNFLKQNFPGEVAVAHWLRGNISEALFYINEAYLLFMREWSQINEWDIRLKTSCLLKLQALSELESIVSIVSSQVQDVALSKVVSQWKSCDLRNSREMVEWDVRFAMRKYFVLLFPTFNTIEVSAKLHLGHFSMVKAALSLQNYDLASKYAKQIDGLELNMSDKLMCRYYTNLKEILYVERNNCDATAQLQGYLKIWSNIESALDVSMETDDSDDVTAHIHYSALKLISSLMSTCHKSKIEVECFDFFPKDKVDLKARWLECAYSYLTMFDNTSKWTKNCGKICVQVAKFHKNNTKSWSQMVKSILSGMAKQNNEARQLFGSVLTMDDDTEDWNIEEEVNKVPVWMFLIWRHQLLSSLAEINNNSNKIKLIQTILRRIADEYPNALSHGLRVSRDIFSDQSVHKFFFLELTKKVLRNRLEELFVNAINNISCPRLRVAYYLEQIILKMSNETYTQEMINEDLKQLQQVINSPDCEEVFKNLLPYNDKIDNLLHIQGNLKSEIRTICRELALMQMKLPQNLKFYSKFLSEFRPIQNFDSEIEMPGQYDGDQEPRTFRHVRIVGFVSTLTVLRSKRRPMKLTILGDDAREYAFLVKFGEDLRQDQRIQQVFRLMGKTLQRQDNSSDCNIISYSVIPLSTCHGLIEWVHGTQPLKALLTREIPGEDIIEAQVKHLRFLSGNTTSSELKSHLNGYENVSHNNIREFYESLVARFHKNALRRSFWKMSVTPEHFISLRSNFGRSLAVMSIAHWILGVGDRHLENILVLTESGRTVGIDFGLAFGFATQILPLPELIPFRMTPQLLSVLSPLHEGGCLKETMIRMLRFLREDPSILLAVLEVFVLEPCIDWQNQAQKQAMELEGSLEKFRWDARQKIEHVEGKLNGCSPLVALEADLLSGHHKNSMYPHFLRALKGELGTNARTKMAMVSLSPKEQVESLLDLATDPVVLGLTYVGWIPWL